MSTSDSLDHFINLARRGDSPGASSGEQRAFKLAMAVIDNLPGLDATAMIGLSAFIFLRGESPGRASTLFCGPTR